jgi:hypothetical protein
MAAGLGFKTFTTGEVLTAADVNGYLMQGVLVFASEAARNSAITSPQEGQFAYTKDNNSLWYYTGSAWAASGATGDIEGVTAGVGISGGGTSGTVTITNDMATTITASGDIVVGTGSGTYDNLPIGTTGQVLTADTTVSPYKVKWATPAGGGKVLQVVSTHWTSSFSTTSASYVDVTNGELAITPSSASSKVLFIGSWYAKGQGSNDQNGGDLRIVRGATEIDEPGFLYHLLGSNSQPFSTQAAIGAHYLDSPATTSSTTYKIQIKQYNGTAYLERGGVITLMEIGA